MNPRSIFAERVRGRRSIYLDTNAWSDLSEQRSKEAREASAAAQVAHVAGLTVFPLAYATITEMIKRDANPASLRQIDLMDQLSLGVSLRGHLHVRDLETMCAFQFMTTGMSEAPLDQMFTALFCYDSDREIPAVGLPSHDDHSSVLRIAYPTLRWLHSTLRTPEVLALEATTDEKYVAEMSKKIIEAEGWAKDGSGKLNAKKLRFEEHSYAFSQYVLGRLRHLVGLEGLELIHERLPLHLAKRPGPAATAAIIAAMPSVALSCEMHVQRALAKAPIRAQDFYDHEHAALAIPYVDAFVTSDGGLLDVLRRAKANRTYKCEILPGVAALARYLIDLIGPESGPPNSDVAWSA